MRSLTCYESLTLASKCVRAARALRGIDLMNASRLLLNAATYVSFADQRREQAPYCGSSIQRLIAAIDCEVDYQSEMLADALDAAHPSHRAEA